MRRAFRRLITDNRHPITHRSQTPDEPFQKKHRDYKSLLQGAQILLTLAVAIGVLFSSAPTADGFIAFDHRTREEFIGKRNNLIRRVHKDQWVIGYAYMDNCPPEKRKNGPAIEEVITQALNAWLQPVRDLTPASMSSLTFALCRTLMLKMWRILSYMTCVSFSSAILGNRVHW